MTTALHMTPLGYTSSRPVGLPPIDRARLLRAAHAIARQFRAGFATYAEALSYGLRAAWAQVKVARTFQSLRAQVAPVQHTPPRSRQAGVPRGAAARRCGPPDHPERP
jgi:hypothetical protein